LQPINRLLSHKISSMTKYGLRTRVMLLTILPTVLIGVLLAGYFMFQRYQQLNNFMIDQGINIIEPLAIASEFGMQQNSRESLKQLLGVTHRKHSPDIKSIAIFDSQDKLFVTSNYHRNFSQLRLPKGKPIPRVTEYEIQDDYIILRTPILAETGFGSAPLSSAEDSVVLGYVALQLVSDQILLLQYRDSVAAALIVLIGILISMRFSFRLMKDVSEPITHMVAVVDMIRQGRLDTRVTGRPVGELGMLKNGINSMAKSLAEYHEEMQQNIDQATSDLRETLEQIEIQNVELDMAKKRAQEAARVKSEFLANMSHELRTPLNGVIGFARQLLKTSLTASQTDYLQTIEKSANNLLTIINDILDFSKLEADKLTLERIPFHLRDTVDEVLTLLAHSAHEKGIELALHVDPSVPLSLLGDPLRLQQVLTNLVSNAIKFTEQGNVTIHISQRPSPDSRLPQLLFAIKDTGIGISEQQQQELFQAFRQADTSITRRYGGTGLGLVITQRLVQQMGGEISLSSELNKGSQFCFTMALEQAPFTVGYKLPQEALKGKRTLLYEPSEPARLALEQQLSQWQMDVTPCANEAQWLAACDGNYDVVLLGLNEAEAITQFKRCYQQFGGHTQRMLVLVSSNDPGLQDQLLSQGADSCLSKPCAYRKLAETLLDGSGRHAGQEPIQIRPPRAWRQMAVLAVDDNPANLKLISAMLQDQVTQVDVCSDGGQALSLCRQRHYDLIFMDIQMPVMDGISATQAIRQLPTHSNTPIIAVTAHALTGERERLLASGMDDYLTKPIDEAALEAILAQWHQTKHRPVPSQPQVQNQIDWQVAEQQAAGKPELAREMLTMLVDSFDSVCEATRQALAGELPADQYQAIIHRFHGGCSYSGVPKLCKLVGLIEQQLKEALPVEEMEPELLELLDAIEQTRSEAQLYLS